MSSKLDPTLQPRKRVLNNKQITINMKNKKYLTEPIPAKVRLALYRKALRLLKEDGIKYQGYYGYGLCVFLRQLLFDRTYDEHPDNHTIIMAWSYPDTTNRLPELTKDRIESIQKIGYSTVDVTKQRIVVLNEMINQLK